MTSKERVMAAVSHHAGDRIPCGFVSTPEVDDMLLRHFGTDNMETVLERLGVDTRPVMPAYVGPPLRTWEDGRYQNYWGHIRKAIRNESGTYNESVEFPYAAFQTVADVEAFAWPRLEWFDFTPITDAIDSLSEYALILGSTGMMDMINGTSFGRGTEQVMIDIALEDPVGFACMDKRFDFSYRLLERGLEVGEGKIDIVWIGDDFGSQNGLLISPDAWEKLFFPRIRKLCDLIHNHGAKAMLHSCGSTRRIWPRLITAGVDIYDTVQPEAVDMEFDSLYAEFGSRMAMHGSISTQSILPFGTPDDVRAVVRARKRTVGTSGGLILAPAHNFQPDTPLENILAFYDEVCNGG